jgi:hypothetical protein
MRRISWLVAIPVLAVGCSGQDFKVVPVSGRITKNGEPLANVRVVFQPMEGENPGPGSAGTTDADGRYTLIISSQQFSGKGAVVGKHRVTIGTILPGEGSKPTDPSVGSPDGEPLAGKELIPPEYNQDSTLTFDVPAGGTDKADFDLRFN